MTIILHAAMTRFSQRNMAGKSENSRIVGWFRPSYDVVPQKHTIRPGSIGIYTNGPIHAPVRIAAHNPPPSSNMARMKTSFLPHSHEKATNQPAPDSPRTANRKELRAKGPLSWNIKKADQVPRRLAIKNHFGELGFRCDDQTAADARIKWRCSENTLEQRSSFSSPLVRPTWRTFLQLP